MSKSDAMRAMREARYAGTSTAVPTRRVVPDADGAPTAAAAAPAAPKVRPARATEPKKAESKSARIATDEPATATGVEQCGHKSMNGRACTRASGHPEKSHRYS